ncbi:TolB family protein [candidate division KSB1 bacterium]|nr:TolB family protein [candidate division KSB1 bacterium]
MQFKILFFLLFLGTTMTRSNELNMGVFSKSSDVGPVAIHGSVTYDTENQTYKLEGSGTNMWFGQDEFFYVYKRLTGDFILRARAEFIGEGVDPHRKIGWIIRNSLESGSAHVNACVHGDGLTSLQFRASPNTDTEEIKSPASAPDIIQLERRGPTYIMSTACFGEPFTVVQLDDADLGDSVYVGIYVCSHNPQVTEKAVFRNVRIVIPPPSNFQPYRDYIGSHLEILDVETGHRKILYSAPNSLQAPNWTQDGYLIYNSDGLLYRFHLEDKKPEKIDTGFAIHNNNDHVLSFDGRYLAISHHSDQDLGNSIIYTLPVTGGTPERITEKGPSYLHGWSPDGRELLFTGARNDQYDIYKIFRDTKTEVQLTNTKGLDDGSEYTPDGEYIYFNSNRTGTMQIWRMKPDGSNQEQITFDDFNNWFPHISPDGQWIVFLSYGPEIDSGDHPFYKYVYLRLMPLGGGKPRVIAYVFGGQGTINVPSWSPDSKKIAFVSNTKLDTQRK